DELIRFSNHLPLEFAQAIKMIEQCPGSIIVTGIGKAGWIGQKISATFASTGTPSHFLHPAEAYHGDFGRITASDLVLILSNSGETEEITGLIPTLRQNGTPLIGLTASSQSPLGQACDCTVAYGHVQEADVNGLAPSTSTTLMLAIGDGIALTVSQMKNFSPVQFSQFHPGGSLGLKLKIVEQVMRPLKDCRITQETFSVRQSISAATSQRRPSGAILILDEQGRLSGIFTDSDLVRCLRKQQDQFLDLPISDVMTRNPVKMSAGKLVADAIERLSVHSISELPIVNLKGEPIGLIDITDLIR
ncbi:MAG: KpsF/GutQ family sugar-phosphate isomerase, partial [Planctomycetota bacterium]|nr:KpsF/GutQ family sugar-phosphate isomerase [Planctomycetota bacterium]